MKNGSKICSAWFGSNPVPESCTWTSTPSACLADLIKVPWPVGECTHCVDSVHDEIDQDLLQLHLVAQDAWQISGQIEDSETLFRVASLRTRMETS